MRIHNTFQLIPHEILQEIALELVKLTPLGPPTALLPLLLTCKSFYSALSPIHAPTLASRIFAFKFDASPVVRREFRPTTAGYAEQLEANCRCLQALKAGDVQGLDVEETLLAVLVMMMENEDGRNRAQLEWARAGEYAERWVREKLYETRGMCDGWPEESMVSACALWVMWMFTTKEKLHAETPIQREQLISLVLPFVLLPYRYASSHAPPNHFQLPLPVSSSAQAHNTVPLPLSIPTPHGPYPIYNTSREWTIPFYTPSSSSSAATNNQGSSISTHHPTPLSPPCASTAAKLLYFSRRELLPFGIAPHLPATRAEAIARHVPPGAPTQEDMREVNAHLGAPPPRRVVWDWRKGRRVVDGVLESEHEHEVVVRTGGESNKWDCDWWRLRLCGDLWRRQPRWRPGRVYVPGCMRGLWQGRLLVSYEQAHNARLANPAYPSTQPFSEASVHLRMQPVFMRLEEHWALPEHVDDPHQPRDRIRVTLDFNAEHPHRGAGGGGYLYETYHPEKRSAHDPERCVRCLEREEVMRRRREEELERVERVFAGVGLGRGEEERVDEFQPSFTTTEEEEDGEDGDDMGDDSVQEGDSDDTEQDQHPVHHPLPPCTGAADIILTGMTDHRHAMAWNPYKFYGRVREWDGLIGILRVARYPLVEHVFFYGYLVGGQNFVGNWRVAAADPLMPAWESAFTMSKREDS
ncbi:hypothetical protein BDQ12DRAFT_598949 [Crucibulum laeve]|uniref:F-box domain-containing protein n=1 Tax=Crucibulum laeve TaxID=68775 RepID=A0A5C3MC44_9AGAR|nr:hypothetical protein BDQ12DRAFT_598949 [Crucibulum laeve]